MIWIGHANPGAKCSDYHNEAVDRVRYSDHLDNLHALITYLALTRWRSRSPNGLARDLNLEESAITRTLDIFPGLFRKSSALHETDVGNQHSYTLHARYARRCPRGDDPPLQASEHAGQASRSDPAPSQDGSGEELDAVTLRMLLDFVSEQARAERDANQHIRSERRLLTGVVIAAAASVSAAIIQSLRYLRP